jgi:catechol 2,3-dioxygenase-like lactoylglutathione lyase family enzyme
MAVIGIDHVQVAAPAGCEAQARAFYGDLLGMEELPKPDALAVRGGCWFAAGAQELHVGVAEGFTPARKAHPSFVVTDLDDVAARLTGAGIEVAYDDLIPGTSRFEAADPFGNRVEFRQAKA